MRHNILLVEDDAVLAKNLREVLTEKLAGDCTWVPSLMLAETLLNETEQKFELLILDRILPDGDGLRLLQQIETLDFEMRVLVLSKMSEAREREIGLRCGASDYLPKPFTMGELIERVKKLLLMKKLRRLESFFLRDERDQLTFAPAEKKLFYNDREVNLTKADVELLEYLFAHRDFLITREEIERCLWQGNQQEMNKTAINAQIYRLRKKMGKFGNYLKTFYNLGYQLRSEMMPMKATRMT